MTSQGKDTENGVKRKAREFLSAYRTIFSLEVIGIALFATLIAASTGPFGTFSTLGFFERLGYWGTVSVSSVVLGYAGFSFAQVVGCDVASRCQNSVGALIAAVLITGAVWGMTQFGFGDVLKAPPVAFLFINVLLITTAVGVVRQAMTPRRVTDPEEPPERDMALDDGTEDPRPRLARRLPEGIDGAILHLSVSDHHVDIHTENGSASVRMRLGDAIEVMDGVPGIRVHRSHWVARDAIEGVARDNGRLFLILRTGARVPVSRGARPKLEEAGLL